MTKEERIAKWREENQKPIQLEIELEPATYKMDNGNILYQKKVINGEEVDDLDSPLIDIPALTAICLVKKPTIEYLDVIQTKYKDDANGAALFLFENCWISGDQIINEFDELKLSAALKMFSLFKMKIVEIKKK